MDHVLNDAIIPGKQQVTANRIRFHTPGPEQPRSPSLPQSFPHTPGIKIKGVTSGAFLTSTRVEDRRIIIATRDVPKMIPEVPLDDYLQHILPPLNQSLQGHIDDIISILEHNGTIDIAGDRWVAFPLDPVVAREREAVIFQGLTTIFNAVVSAAKQIDTALVQTFGLVVAGDTPIYSDRGASDSQPDAFNKLFTPTQEEQKAAEGTNELEEAEAPGGQRASKRINIGHHHLVYDLANPQQFKCRENAAKTEDDVIKLVYDMTQILALDPCRRFTFGTTIENRTSRLWFLSRGTLLKSTSFDFIKERRILVHLFLSLAFSSLNKMGWDPTMTVNDVEKSGRRQYKIDVDGETYTTVEILSDLAAESPLGRATRVWRVMDCAGSIHVLKDVWLDFDRLGEHEIREVILKDVYRTGGRRYVKIIEDRMLTPIAFGKVQVDGSDDDTTEVMLGGYDLVGVDMSYLLAPTIPGLTKTTSLGKRTPADRDSPPQPPVAGPILDPPTYSPPHRAALQNALDERAQKKLTHHRRYHYRIVFEECATTIYDERSFGNIFRALGDVVKALWILHKAGWVHRDISGGNVYWYDNGKRRTGLLGDFEYARAQTDSTIHDLRTGTPFFMAAETLRQRYLFQDQDSKQAQQATRGVEPDLDSTWEDKVVEPDLEASREDQKSVNNSAPSDTSQKDAAVPFFYNPLHDLESVWWIIIYVLFFNDDLESLSAVSARRQTTMDSLFHGTLDFTERLLFLKDPEGLRDARRYLTPTFDKALDLLDEFRRNLKTAYIDSEKPYPKAIDDHHFLIHHLIIEPLFMNPTYMKPLSNIVLLPMKATAKHRMSQVDEPRPTKRSR